MENLRTKSLVLYKNNPAVVSSIGPKKIEIQTGDGETINVRFKDVIELHRGPVESLADLRPVDGDVETAWELLAGETTTLPELADLAYGEYTPATAWATWQLTADGLYFSGPPDAVLTHTAESVEKERKIREAKADEKQAWEVFIKRLEQGYYEAEDQPYLLEVVALAREEREHSRVLKTLGQSQTPENAHALLLKIGYWDFTFNPYPARSGLSTKPPNAEVPDLPSEQRRDLTHLLSLAIDDEGSRDPDDAISLDGSRLWVHIADVASLVPVDSPADSEARSRGANIYLPEGTVTMLPQKATNLLGLGLSETSPALSFGLDINPQGQVLGLEIVPSWVRVTRLTYEEAENRLEELPLSKINQLAQRYEDRRGENGAIDITLPEVKVWVEDGRVMIRHLHPLRSRDLVREAMLMTGAAVANFALENNIPLPFTGQEAPAEPPPGAKTPSENFALRRLMKASQQSSAPIRHSGLGMDHYVRATSPLRRYLDLVVHQQLRSFLRGEELLDVQKLMERVGAANAVTRNVRWAERRSIDHWTLVYLLQNPKWVGEGILVDLRGRRGNFLIPKLGLETQLYLKQDMLLDSLVKLKLGTVELATLEAHFRQLTPGGT